MAFSPCLRCLARCSCCLAVCVVELFMLSCLLFMLSSCSCCLACFSYCLTVRVIFSNDYIMSLSRCYSFELFIFANSGNINVEPDRNVINPRLVVVNFTDPTLYPLSTALPMASPQPRSHAVITAAVVTPVALLAGIIIGAVTYQYLSQ